MIKKLEQNIKNNTDRSSHKLYKESVVTEKVGGIMDVPRDVRQINYLKEKVKTDERPTKDALINLQAIAYEDKGFVHLLLLILV